MKTLTACTLDCPDACSLVVETDNMGVKRILGNPDTIPLPLVFHVPK
jgi:hypothetical protein